MKKHKKTMRYQLVSGLCLLNIILLLLVGYYLFVVYGQTAKTEIRESLNELSDAAAGQIDSSLANLEQAALDLSVWPKFEVNYRRFLMEPEDYENNLRLLTGMESAYKNRNNIRRVILLAPDGSFLSTGEVDADRKRLQQILNYAQGESEKVYTNTMIYYPVCEDYMDRAAESQVLTAIYPIRLDDAVQGYILVQQNISYFGNAINMSLGDFPVDVLMVWRNTNVLYSSFQEEAQTAEFLTLSREYSNNKETETCLLSIQGSAYWFMDYVFVLSKQANATSLQRIFYVFFALLCTSAACTLAYLIIVTYRVTKPMEIVVDHMEKWNLLEEEDNHPQLRVSTYEAERLLETYQQMIIRQKEIYNQSLQLEKMQERTLFSALQSEISPHFMFNTLGSIAELCIQEDAVQAADNCFSLANLLRYASGYATEEVMLGQELENLEYYMKLMKVRYRNRLEYQFMIEDKCRFLYMPKLTLQPLVENSIKYASDGSEKISLRVEALCGEDRLIIIVQDNGMGISQEAIDRVADNFERISDKRDFQEVLEQIKIGNMGLSGTLIRLKLFYKEDFEYLLEGTAQGTSVILKIRYGNYI